MEGIFQGILRHAARCWLCCSWLPKHCLQRAATGCPGIYATLLPCCLRRRPQVDMIERLPSDPWICDMMATHTLVQSASRAEAGNGAGEGSQAAAALSAAAKFLWGQDEAEEVECTHPKSREQVRAAAWTCMQGASCTHARVE